jgi:ribulose-phosphate 3-epimerase
MIEVHPSLLAADFSKLMYELKEVATADGIHLDVMDGVFVPNISFGPVVVNAVRRVTALPLDCHLMIIEPQRYLKAFRKAGADMITIHVETVDDPPAVIKEIRKLDAEVGLTLNPETHLSSLLPFLAGVDQVLVMSVRPGFGGQAFMWESIDRIEELAHYRAERELSFRIAVDGGVGPENAAEIVAAGADVLVGGTSIFGRDDRALAIKELRGAEA